MNPLATIPPAARKVLYAVYAWLGLAAAATEVAYHAAHLGQPLWLTIALSVYAFVGTSVGATAVTHTPARKP